VVTAMKSYIHLHCQQRPLFDRCQEWRFQTNSFGRAEGGRTPVARWHHDRPSNTLADRRFLRTSALSKLAGGYPHHEILLGQIAPRDDTTH
jgi:hypothetical protein